MSDDIRSLVKNNAALYRAVEDAQEASRRKSKDVQHLKDIMTLDPEIVERRKKKKK